MSHNKHIVDLTPTEIARSIKPGFQAIVRQKLKHILLEQLDPHIEEILNSVLYECTVLGVHQSHSLNENKIVFRTEFTFEDLSR
jgi:hypothetical protein